MQQNTFYSYENEEEETVTTRHCCDAKRMVTLLSIIPIVIGVILILIGAFFPCVESYQYECTHDFGVRTCCSATCDIMLQGDPNSVGDCDEVSLFGGFFVFGILMCGVGVVVFLVFRVVTYVKDKDKDDYEEVSGTSSTSTSTYKRDSKAYTVTYDTYPPTYHSHGPQ
jgi:hypothetical protein